MSELNTTLVVQLNEDIDLPSSGNPVIYTTPLAKNASALKQDGSLGIIIDGVYRSGGEYDNQEPTEAGADANIILCTSHVGKNGSTIFTRSSEFKKSEIVSASYSDSTADVARVELDPNGASGTDNDGALAKAGRFGVGSTKGARRYETLAAISSGSFNQYTYDKVNPLTNVDSGQDFDLYTITVRKKNAKRYTTEVIRIFINHLAEFTKYALETTLGLGALADVTPPVQGTTFMVFGNAPYSIGATPRIDIDITTAEAAATYSITLTTNDTPVYTKTYTDTIPVASNGDKTHQIFSGTTAAKWDWGQTAAGSTITLSGSVTDPFGNTTDLTFDAATMRITILS